MCRWCTILLVAEVQSIDKRLSWCYVSLSTETARNLLPHCSEGSSSSSHPIDSWTWKVDGDLRVANRWTYQSHRGRQREIAADPAKLFQVFFNTISMMKTRIKGFMREADVTKTLIYVKLYSKQDKVNNADSAFIFLIIQSQNQWSGQRRWPCLVWSLLER